MTAKRPPRGLAFHTASIRNALLTRLPDSISFGTLRARHVKQPIEITELTLASAHLSLQGARCGERARALAASKRSAVRVEGVRGEGRPWGLRGEGREGEGREGRGERERWRDGEGGDQGARGEGEGKR